MASDNKKPIVLVGVDESEAVARAVRVWLNSCPERPVSMRMEFEWLGTDGGMCLSTVRAPFKTKQYIDGTYQAQYQFNILYRVTALNADERLSADELLNRFGAWAENNTDELAIGDNIRVRNVARDTNAALMVRYDDGSEDHGITMKVTYEVN